MKQRTRGMVEAEFTKAMVQFEKEHLGRGPRDARTFFIENMILVRLQGILTPAEEKLAQNSEGKQLVKEMRRQLFENSRPLIEDLVTEIIDCSMISLHTDMSTKTGERVVVLVVDENLEKEFPE